MSFQPASLTSMAQFFISSVIQPGDHVIDTTVGNGNDTIFMAEKVGPTGMVYGFDIQNRALEQTREKLKAGKIQQVRLIEKSHDQLNLFIKQPVKAVMFNLGYLPGYDSLITTEKNTTLNAFSQSLNLLMKNGMITVIAYRSHFGGEEEYQAILNKICLLDERKIKAIQYQFPNSRKTSPVLFILIKKV